MTKQKTLDMTEGVIWKQLLKFFFPLLLGTFFQMLYNIVDTMIVGRCVGTTALSAVGGTAATLIFVFVGLFTGISSGATVVTSQAFGAGRADEVSRAIHTGFGLAIAGGLLLTAVVVGFAPMMLTALHTPADSLPESITYLRIYGCGMLFNMFFNMGSAVFQAVGDSRRPFYILVTATLTNIVLDVLLVAVVPAGVAGAAIATIFSQGVAAALVILTLIRTTEIYRLNLRKIRIDKEYLLKILHIGIPAAVQAIMFSFSNMLIQASVNTFGTVVVAGWAVTGKIESIYWMIVNSLGTSITTFVGQNFGAGKMPRVYRGIRQALAITFTFALIFCMTFYIGAPVFLNIFSTDPSVIKIGILIERFFAPTYLTYVLIEILSGSLRGMGDSIVPTFISIFGICVFRIAWLLLVVPMHHTVWTVSWSYPVSWSVTSAAYVIYFIYRYRRRKKADRVEG